MADVTNDQLLKELDRIRAESEFNVRDAINELCELFDISSDRATAAVRAWAADLLRATDVLGRHPASR